MRCTEENDGRPKIGLHSMTPVDYPCHLRSLLDLISNSRTLGMSEMRSQLIQNGRTSVPQKILIHRLEAPSITIDTFTTRVIEKIL
jgi:hypothetical protein